MKKSILQLLLKSLINLLLLTPLALWGQDVKINYIQEIEVKEDSFLLKSGMVNYGAPTLVNIEISILFEQYRSSNIIFKQDSIYISEGLNIIEKKILFNRDLLNLFPEDSTVEVLIEVKDIISNSTFQEKKEANFIKKDILVNPLNDSLLITKNTRDKYSFIIKITDLTTNKRHSAEGILYNDTIIKGNSLNLNNILTEKQVELIFHQNQDTVKIDTVYLYIDKFYPNLKQLKENKSILTEINRKYELIPSDDFPVQNRNGEFSISNYSYSKTPSFDDGSQFPNTIVRLTNSMDVYSVPILIEGYYSTSDRVHSAFKDYFNVRLDASTLRNRKMKDVLANENYKIEEIENSIDANKNFEKRLVEVRQLLEQNPNAFLNVDSLVAFEVDSLSFLELQDSLDIKFPLSDSNIVKDKIDTLNQDWSKDSVPKLDSTNIQSLQKIDNYLNRINKNIDSKEKLKKDLILRTEQVDPTQFNGNYIYQLGENNFESILLRFDNLEIGNFYEYTGDYSIRDIEIKGFNTTFRASPSFKVSLLTGKINDILFGTNIYGTSDKKVNSIGIIHNTLDEKHSTILRFTSFENNQDEFLQKNNQIYSGLFRGELFSSINYEMELNYSTKGEQVGASSPQLIQRNSANYIKVSANPFQNVNLFVRYDYVGSNYDSDGVYFMLRNLESYDLGTDVGIFKNKLKAKVSYRFIKRNISEETVQNDNKKWLFELRSNLRRYPNFHIIHSPATMELASQIDTSLVKLTATSYVTIYRVFYQKRIKRTVLTSTVMYNNISNSYNYEINNSQSSVLSSFHILNDKRGFSINMSHLDLYGNLRFLSASAQQNILKKHLLKIYLLKYFDHNQEYVSALPEYLIRSSVEFTIKKNYMLGIGSIVTTYKNHAPEIGLSIEGRIRW